MSDRKTPSEHRARPIGPEAMKAFAHPLRMAMYDLLSQRGSATATTLAAELGESTGQTSYHLRQLERHGFVVEDEGRGTARERWWKAVGYSLEGVELAENPATSAQVELLLRTQVEQHARDKVRWLQASREEPQEWVKASLNDTTTAWMTAEELLALQEDLVAVLHEHHTRAKERGEREGVRRVRIYLDILPLPHVDDDAS